MLFGHSGGGSGNARRCCPNICGLGNPGGVNALSRLPAANCKVQRTVSRSEPATMYTEDQLQQYFRHIGFAPGKYKNGSLDLLAALQRHHLARVPFENVSLHYSTHRLLSLDLQDLFDKIVHNSRGGYCMELNAFLGAVLRSLGFTLISAGARVKTAGSGYTGW